MSNVTDKIRGPIQPMFLFRGHSNQKNAFTIELVIFVDKSCSLSDQKHFLTVSFKASMRFEMKIRFRINPCDEIEYDIRTYDIDL